ncbi:MAG: MBL fold metallo-hydrolase [Fibrobacterota bacterium]
MEIQFCGAAQTVTGSQHLVNVNGKKLLLDCGLYQGRRQEAFERNINFPFRPSEIDAVVLSHAHMDHSGNLPNLIKQGFTGRIYATPVTVELCKLMLRDSAHLQAHDIEWVNKIRKKQDLPPARPLYTIAEAEAAMENFVEVEYNKAFTPVPDVTATFSDAGHILGSAGVLLEITEKGRNLRLGYSGDIGRAGMPITRDPVVLTDLDALIIESTYGGRLHGPFDEVEEELSKTIRDTVAYGGKLLIPAFAIGRTQTLVYILHKLFDQDRIPEVPIYVDSPLACNATEIYRAHAEVLDREAERIFLKNHEDPFSFRRLTYVRDRDESKKLNDITYPHIIISASGMCEGGRILHHLRNNVHNPNTMLLFIGYAAQHTLARKIMDNERNVKILGEEHTVRCKIKIMDNFSAHGDRRDILEYVKATPPSRLKHIFLVHGEPEQTGTLRDALRSQGYPDVRYPELKSVHTV